MENILLIGVIVVIIQVATLTCLHQFFKTAWIGEED
jgi:hypothetical protein